MQNTQYNRAGLIVIVLIVIGFQPFTSYSQEVDTTSRIGRLHRHLQSMIEQKYGPYFSVIQVLPFDSLVGRQSEDRCGSTIGFTDPFGTLRGGTLFSVHGWYSTDDSNCIAIYKNGHIIWQSNWITGGFSGLTGIEDINRDGKVDLLTQWKYCRLSPSPNSEGVYDRECTAYLSIVSWDGARGTMLNGIDSSGKSTITGDCFQLQPFGKKHIMQIHARHLSEGDEEMSEDVYRWNGSTYIK